jgi:hypothetical protein
MCVCVCVCCECRVWSFSNFLFFKGATEWFVVTESELREEMRQRVRVRGTESGAAVREFWTWVWPH